MLQYYLLASSIKYNYMCKRILPTFFCPQRERLSTHSVSIPPTIIIHNTSTLELKCISPESPFLRDCTSTQIVISGSEVSSLKIACFGLSKTSLQNLQVVCVPPLNAVPQLSDVQLELYSMISRHSSQKQNSNSKADLATISGVTGMLEIKMTIVGYDQKTRDEGGGMK
jgi:hypothetical protein